MPHKGYTLNYFIDFFSAIPNHRWTTGIEQVEGTERHCAIGHALRNNRTTLDNTNSKTIARAQALQDFLADSVEGINDADGSDFAALGTTPRGRILRALRNRKRTGDIFGNNDVNS